MSKKKYKLQTPSYLKDSIITESLGFDKSFLSNCKSGNKQLSDKRINELYALISAIRLDLGIYMNYLSEIVGDGEGSEKNYVYFSDSVSGSYIENHKIIDK